MNKVLVVEDDPAIRGLVDHVLRRAGYEVSLAVDGIAALEVIARDRFDVILVDLMMPRMNGEEFLRTVVERQPSVLKCVIVLTAFVKATRTLPFEPYAVVTKPFDIHELVRQVKACAEQSAQAQDRA